MLSLALGGITEALGGPFLALRRGTPLLGAPPVARLEGSAAPALAPLTELPDAAYPELRPALARLGLQVFRGVVPPSALGAAPRPPLELVVSAGAEQARAPLRPIPSGDAPLSFALASCFYGHGRGRSAFGAALERATRASGADGAPIDFTLLVGDNVYADIAPDQRSFPVATGAWDEIATRYVEYFTSEDRLAPVLRSSPTLVTYDDHELWNDFPFSSAWLARSSEPHAKLWARASAAGIDTFQHPLNPKTAGLNRSFSVTLGGVDFFVADTRTERTTDRLMKQDRWDALCAWLVSGDRPKVLVLGQPLWQGATSKALFATSDHNLAHYAAQFRQLCAALEAAAWDVLVLSGDVHFSRLLQLRVGPSGAKRVYELVSSPAQHIPSTGATVGHYLFDGGLSGEGRTEVEVGHGPGLFVDPRHRLEKKVYRVGTGCPHAHALVQLSRVGAGRVDVRTRFVDHRPASATPTPLPPELQPVSFSLRRR